MERVLGFTAGNNASVAFDAKTSTILYTAGCVVVAESCTTGQQNFIQSPSRKLITCLDASPDGQFLATGEFGHQPKVRLWSRANHCQVAEFSSHHFRVSCVRFCPNSRNLVSVGNQDDQTICVWDRVQLQKIASAKVTAKDVQQGALKVLRCRVAGMTASSEAENQTAMSSFSYDFYVNLWIFEYV
ncbi:unnamed protein product [Dibothriocephalus latus]|uniref:Anaphase-promoting complex subunit 4 WD40 domain-containing protein n=1 Tax=Dibothriocephalus latus TaxID=60516 RepID=A0A3P7NI87_DIBLA|nr:unnamed protein product [Dibothriocephalus latus]